MAKTKRNSNIELLRVVAMIMIVAHHFTGVGSNLTPLLAESFSFGWEPSFNKILIQFFAMGGKIGVDLFMIISGYFMVKQKSSATKIINLWTQVAFYSIVLYFISWLLGFKNVTLSLSNFVHAALPVNYTAYWFVSAYFIIYLGSNFINKMVENITKKQFRMLLLGLIAISLALPTFINSNWDLSYSTLFLLLYLTGAYIRLYQEDIDKFKYTMPLFLGVGLLSTYGFALIVDGLSVLLHSQWMAVNSYYLVGGTHSVWMYIISIGIFLFVLNKKPTFNKLINIIATATFGVYLIHMNPNLSMWTNIIYPYRFKNYGTLKFIGASVATIIMVFFICTLIELIRQKAFNLLRIPNVVNDIFGKKKMGNNN
jgi:surface polysaccharide O-acyltransferase-like enzyme